MSNDPNLPYLNTSSQKLYRVSPLKNYLVEKIDQHQPIKRLTRYLTTTPLMNRGMTYDQKRLEQPDLNDSLLDVITTDTNASIKEPVLIPYPFNDEVIYDQRISIYVYSPRTSFGGKSLLHSDQSDFGKHHFYIDIVYPMVYDRVEPFGQERSLLIACEILNLFDQTYVGESLESVVGRCQFMVSGDVTSLRLSKTGYMVTSIPLSVIAPTRRLDQTRLER